MKFKKTGIEFGYHGDTITRKWPFTEGPVLSSSEYGIYFSNFNEYWSHVGAAQAIFKRTDSKLEGFSYGEILAQWVRHHYPHESIAILKDVNVEERGLSFWAKIPKDKLEHIQKDVIVLRCGSKEKACEIVDSIEHDFAEAFAFSEGNLINYN